MDDTEKLYCDGCGAELSADNDHYDEITGGHFCDECYNSFDDESDFAVDPDFDKAQDYSLNFDVDDDFDSYEESADIKRSEKLSEAGCSGFCLCDYSAGAYRSFRRSRCA